jgi:hypothetical protein
MMSTEWCAWMLHVGNKGNGWHKIATTFPSYDAAWGRLQERIKEEDNVAGGIVLHDGISPADAMEL